MFVVREALVSATGWAVHVRAWWPHRARGAGKDQLAVGTVEAVTERSSASSSPGRHVEIAPVRLRCSRTSRSPSLPSWSQICGTVSAARATACSSWGLSAMSSFKSARTTTTRLARKPGGLICKVRFTRDPEQAWKMTSRRVLARGAELYVEMQGSGGRPDRGCFRHGGIGSADDWVAQVPALVNAGFRVVAMGFCRARGRSGRGCHCRRAIL